MKPITFDDYLDYFAEESLKQSSREGLTDAQMKRACDRSELLHEVSRFLCPYKPTRARILRNHTRKLLPNTRIGDLLFDSSTNKACICTQSEKGLIWLELSPPINIVVASSDWEKKPFATMQNPYDLFEIFDEETILKALQSAHSYLKPFTERFAEMGKRFAREYEPLFPPIRFEAFPENKDTQPREEDDE